MVLFDKSSTDIKGPSEFKSDLVMLLLFLRCGGWICNLLH